MLRLPHTTAIDPARAADRFFSGKISLLDVRTSREHRGVRVPCATHIPLSQLHRRTGEVRSDRPVAVLCRSGHRSALAALVLRRRGLDAVSVKGGMGAWLRVGSPAVWPRDPTREMHPSPARTSKHRVA